MNQEQELILKIALDGVKKYQHVLIHNKALFDIYEGDLESYLVAELAQQFSPASFLVVKSRMSPINILRKIVDKLSTIYAKVPRRTIENGTPQDEELLAWYEYQMDVNAKMNGANELFNLHKTTNLEPYIDEGFPRMRAIPSDRTLTLSNDPVDPTRPTILIKFMGKTKNSKGEDVDLIYVYTKDYFIPVTVDGEIVFDVLMQQENPDMINPLGVLPTTYMNRSYYSIVPQIDSDVLRLTKLIPIMISDLNFASCMQSFSIIYGLNVDTSNLTMSPNAFWNFKSDPTSDKNPEIGVIKPTVDVAQVSQYIMGQLSLWLNTKGIRPGTIGTADANSVSSGISKVIDEMDTAEDRQKQVAYFDKAESEMWELITKKLHPYWRQKGLINTNLDFSPNCKVKIEFQEQMPLSRRTDVLNDVILELTNGLTSREKAIKALNPEMSEQEIEELILDIEEEKTETIDVTAQEATQPEDDTLTLQNSNDKTMEMQ